VVTAIDSSVIFDFVIRDSAFGRDSREALESAVSEGRVVACDVVWTEIVGFFPSAQVVRQMLAELRIEFSPLSAEAAFEAGRAWKAYRQRGGPRSRVIADFLIGAHALLQADRLLTRDRGFYRAYFKHLSILDPSRKK
jgi:predicted nucleic acid-binding protein